MDEKTLWAVTFIGIFLAALGIVWILFDVVMAIRMGTLTEETVNFPLGVIVFISGVLVCSGVYIQEDKQGLLDNPY